MVIEKRTFRTVEIRADGSTERVLTGYAALFNEPIELASWLLEEIAPGAFSRSIREGDVRALWSHNPDFIIGRTKNGSLTLSEDAQGLAFELRLPDLSWARDAYEAVSTGLVTGMSFGFSVVREEIRGGDSFDAPYRRVLQDVDLYEISPVAFPAYSATSVEARDLTLLKEKVESLKKEKFHPGLFDIRRKKLSLLLSRRF